MQNQSLFFQIIFQKCSCYCLPLHVQSSSIIARAIKLFQSGIIPSIFGSNQFLFCKSTLSILEEIKCKNVFFKQILCMHLDIQYPPINKIIRFGSLSLSSPSLRIPQSSSSRALMGQINHGKTKLLYRLSEEISQILPECVCL